MLARVLGVTGLLLILSAAVSAAGRSSDDEDIKMFIDLRSKALTTKLRVFENKVKYLLKFNMTESDVEKFRKYTSMSVHGILHELSYIQNYTHRSHENRYRSSRLPIWNMTGQAERALSVWYKACEHIVETNECYKREQNKKEITNILRLADHLINIKTRFVMYKTLYKDMTENKYDNIYNLKSFLQKLSHHFIETNYNPKDVMEEAQYIKGLIKNTYKKNAVEEIREELFSDCPKAEVIDSFWELTVMVDETSEFSNVVGAVVDAGCDYGCIIALLGKALESEATHVSCQIAKHVHQLIQFDVNTYYTNIHFKLAEVIAHATHRRNYLKDVEPCFDVREKLDESTKRIVISGSGCIENQLYKKAFMFTKPGFDYDKEKSMVFVTDDDEDGKNAKWSFESDGSDRFWVRHKNSGKYLYSSEVPFNAGNMEADETNVFTYKNRGQKSSWFFHVLPGNRGVRILNEEMRYLYATDVVVEGRGTRYVAVWQGEGTPPGSVWKIVLC